MLDISETLVNLVHSTANGISLKAYKDHHISQYDVKVVLQALNIVQSATNIVTAINKLDMIIRKD